MTECWVCGKKVGTHGDPITQVLDPHPSKETKGWCAGSNLEPKDDIW